MSFRFRSISEVPSHLLRAPVARVELTKPPQRKYRNIPIFVDGKRFDSKLESRCYIWLTVLRKVGDILWFIRQPSFDLPGGVRYRADFLVVTTKIVYVLDAKGKDTQESKNKRKQVKELYGVEVVLWTDKK